jgi:hypothetical protein
MPILHVVRGRRSLNKKMLNALTGAISLLQKRLTFVSKLLSRLINMINWQTREKEKHASFIKS